MVGDCQAAIPSFATFFSHSLVVAFHQWASMADEGHFLCHGDSSPSTPVVLLKGCRTLLSNPPCDVAPQQTMGQSSQARHSHLSQKGLHCLLGWNSPPWGAMGLAARYFHGVGCLLGCNCKEAVLPSPYILLLWIVSSIVLLGRNTPSSERLKLFFPNSKQIPGSPSFLFLFHRKSYFFTC